MRKEKEIVIGPDGGRDAGKVFVITEMPAMQGEKWAARALIAATRAGINIPENILGSGFAGVAILGIQALPTINFYDVEPLMDEMFKCIKIRPNPAASFARPLIENGTGDDIEEIGTRILLRKEVLALHMDFSEAAGLSNSTSEAAATSSLQTAQTSPAQSPKRSRLVRQRS